VFGAIPDESVGNRGMAIRLDDGRPGLGWSARRWLARATRARRAPCYIMHVCACRCRAEARAIVHDQQRRCPSLPPIKEMARRLSRQGWRTAEKLEPWLCLRGVGGAERALFAGVAEDTAGSKAGGSSAPRSGAAAAPWVWIEKWVNRGGVNRAERWKLGPVHGQDVVSARASCDGSCRCVVTTTGGHERLHHGLLRTGVYVRVVSTVRAPMTMDVARRPDRQAS